MLSMPLACYSRIDCPKVVMEEGETN